MNDDKPTCAPTTMTPYFERMFEYHPPRGNQPERYVRLRNAGKEFVREILECCPDSEDRMAAIRKVREAVMTANAAIALE